MKYSLFLNLMIGALAVWTLQANAQDKHVTTVNNCTVIDKPGAYQVGKVIQASQRDLIPIPAFPGVFACILIVSDFVTLDLGGNALIGPGPVPGTTSAVFASFDRRAVKIHSGNVAHWGEAIINHSIGARAERITAFHNRNGIAVGRGSHLIENIAHENTGVGLFADQGSRVIGNIAADNGNNGIHVICPAVILENVALRNHPLVPGNDIVAGPNCTREHNNPFLGDQP
jgi:hypothetical protein